jgi:ABC-2 type transport system ATP-binding protein
VREFQHEGRTIVFVTHAPDLVRQICDRAVVLDHGKIVLDGPPGEAVRAFRERIFSGDSLKVETTSTGRAPHIGKVERARPAVPSVMEQRRNLKVRITNVIFEHSGVAEGHSYLLPHEPLDIRVQYDADDHVDDVMFGIAIYDVKGNNLFGSNTHIMGLDVPPAFGPGEVRFSFADVPLLDGTYLVTFAVQTTDAGVVYDWHEQQWQFEVMNPDRTQGIVAMPMTVRMEQPPQASSSAGHDGEAHADATEGVEQPPQATSSAGHDGEAHADATEGVEQPPQASSSAMESGVAAGAEGTGA